MSTSHADDSVATRERRSAFTLVELLVVFSIISMLISILLPSLRKAKDAALTAKCAAGLHQFGRGFSAYFAETDEWIPGRNTTGLEIWQAAVAAIASASSDPDELNQSHLPVQTYDWMTPLLRLTTQLPAKRAQRFRMLLDEYRCPGVRKTARLYTDSSSIIDQAEFEAEESENGPFPSVSYLMPAFFQLFGTANAAGRTIGTAEFHNTTLPYKARAPSTYFSVAMERFEPKLGFVGTPAEKIAVADGTRYLPLHGGLDFDHHYDPERRHDADRQWFGSFTTSGAWWRGSTAYGDMSPSHGENIPLSYRHTDGINALMFDGHAERLSRTHSHKIDYWYPKGATVSLPGGGETDYARYDHGYEIR